MWGVAANYSGAGAPTSYSVKSQVDKEYELCFKCHSSWTTQPSGQGDKALEFNPNNSAYHPVEAAGRNQSAAMVKNLESAGLTPSSVLKCTDCHNNEATSDVRGKASNSSKGPKGPHGSANQWVLRANYNRTTGASLGSYDPNNFSLCFLCHDERMVTENVGGGPQVYTNFGKTQNLHYLHVARSGGGFGTYATCAQCHYNVHSNAEQDNVQFYNNDMWGYWYVGIPPSGNTHLVNFSPDVQPRGTNAKPAWFYFEPPGMIGCDLRCHGADMSSPYGAASYWYQGS
jgi:hypothetical protein